MLRILSTLCFVSILTNLYGQEEKEFETREMIWLAYFNQTRFTDKSGLWVDLHLRLNDFGAETHATLARIAYIYYLSDQVRLVAGYAHQTAYGHDGAPNLPEHRPWQQIQWIEKKSWFTMMQWIRLEERFREKVSDGELTGEYAFNYRIRYNMSFTIPITGKQVVPKTPFLFINNELFINFGKEIVNNYFDQNRVFVGGGYQFTKHLNAQLGYMYIFQQLPSGNQYVNTHALRLFVFHNLDFRKEE
jgi:hypothetical protein